MDTKDHSKSEHGIEINVGCIKTIAPLDRIKNCPLSGKCYDMGMMYANFVRVESYLITLDCSPALDWQVVCKVESEEGDEDETDVPF